MKKFHELIEDRRYIIERKDHELLQGVFLKLVSHSPTSVLMRCMTRKSLPNVSHFGFTYHTDTYYDIEEIRENAKRARITFEQRALNKILKRLINEEFEW